MGERGRYLRIPSVKTPLRQPFRWWVLKVHPVFPTSGDRDAQCSTTPENRHHAVLLDTCEFSWAAPVMAVRHRVCMQNRAPRRSSRSCSQPVWPLVASELDGTYRGCFIVSRLRTAELDISAVPIAQASMSHAPFSLPPMAFLGAKSVTKETTPYVSSRTRLVKT